jgi:hypothetical protein
MSKKYLFLYSGGDKPASEKEGKAVMAAWMAYFGKIGGSLVDGGAPFGPGHKSLGKKNKSGATGYTIVRADSMEKALALTDGHPHVAHGGGIEIFELVDMGEMK